MGITVMKGRIGKLSPINAESGIQYVEQTMVLREKLVISRGYYFLFLDTLVSPNLMNDLLCAWIKGLHQGNRVYE